MAFKFPWERGLPGSEQRTDHLYKTGETIDLSNRRLLIGIPHVDFCTVQWAMQLALLLKPPNYGFALVKGLPVDIARDLIAETVRDDRSITDLIFIDSDVFPEQRDALVQLMSTQGRPIISGVYHSKAFAARWPAAWKKDPISGIYNPISAKQSNRYVEVDVVGMGFCRIDVEVFRKLEPPWFYFQNQRFDPTTHRKLVDGVSEDFWFCERVAKELSPEYRPVVDMELTAAHIGLFWALGDGSLDALGARPPPGDDHSKRAEYPETKAVKAEIKWVR